MRSDATPSTWATGMREVASRVFAYALMVPSMTRRLVAAITRVTRKKVGALVNTHHHLDHT